MSNTREKDFIQRCETSSQEAYAAFKALLNELESPATRKSALRFFHGLVERFLRENRSVESMSRYHFSVSELRLRLEGKCEERLLLLQLPSTFAPEEWSFTFFEGLSRYRVGEFQDRKIVELGCGTGWISLALAKQAQPAKVYGLDINPRAITCARINLYLNAYDREGNSVWQSEGRNLDEIVEFHVSDLLEYCRQRQMNLDRVIGCIPQVLNPDPDFTARMLKGDVNEQESDEFLHSLSNYAPQQGQIEDQFGLGLIARAIEESVSVLRTSGKIILNLGGRPGRQVLQNLFLRRGFTVHPVWHTRVTQAKDTDIQGLCEIERKTSHRFEFFMGHGSDVPINARTALAYAEAGGEIAHGLTVYEARLRDPVHVPVILRLLSKPGYEEARQVIDLSYSDDSLAEEKTSFLSLLADELGKAEFFPYQKTAGLAAFRRRLSQYFRSYFRIHFEEANFVVAPSSAVTCRNLLSLYRPKRALIDSGLASALEEGSEVLEIPRGSDLLCEMMERLRPELVVYSLPEAEARTPDSFLRILEVSARTKTRVFVDISELLELSSTPPNNGVFRYLAENPLPPHVALMCGLVKNRIYEDLQVCFVISENRDLVESLVNAAEVTYSRTPLLSQFYYDRILQELLNFQIIGGSRERPGVQRAWSEEDGFFKRSFIPIAPSAVEAFRHPAIVGERAAQESENLIRLDYGENGLPSPAGVKQALFEAFAQKETSPEEADPTPEILALTRSRWALPDGLELSCVLAGGVAPIFSEIATYCGREGKALVFPEGAYGYFLASSMFHGARIRSVATSAENAFKLTPAELSEALSGAGPGAWVVLSAPIVNPTGAIYSEKELRSLVEVVARHQAIVVLDSIFSGLTFDGTPDRVSDDVLLGSRWVILGGISKELAAGGLRAGFAVTQDAGIRNALRGCALTDPHSTLKFMLKKIYGKLARKNSELEPVLDRQRKELGRRADLLAETLEGCGWKVLRPQGGLFLAATPERLLGRRVGAGTLTLENLADVLREKSGVVINTPGWTGIPGYFRFVLSVSEGEFTRALDLIRTL